MTDTKTRRILYGDNGEMLALVPDASIDMIYMDPPFGSDREYNGKHGRGFSDVWSWDDDEHFARLAMLGRDEAGNPVPATNPTLGGITYDTLSDKAVHGAVATAVEFSLMAGDKRFTAYVLHMGVRLLHYKRVLKPTGNLIIHCDQTASHIIKAMVDAAFGRKNFRNEIIWKRHNKPKPNTRYLPKNHDVILVWGRTDKCFLSKDHLRFAATGPMDTSDYKKDDGDGRGPWKPNQLTSGKPAGGEASQPWRGIDPVARWGRGWSISRKARAELGIEHLGTLAALDALDAAGYIHWTGTGVPQIKQYARWFVGQGEQITDVWDDHGIKPLSGGEAERLGYPTQKPVGLLERLIRLYSPEDGHVLDPFGGCGTTADAAERLGRSWTICDVSIHAIDVIDRRMSDTHGIGEAHGLTIEGNWPGMDLAKIDVLPEFERRRYYARLVGAASLDTDRKGDETQLSRGIHGHFTAKDCTSKTPHGILMVAPTGGNKTDVEVIKRLRREDGAEFAVLLCDAVTDDMRAEAVKAGTWTTPGTYAHERVEVDRVQFVTIPEVVGRGVSDALPSGVRLDLPYVPAKRIDPALF